MDITSILDYLFGSVFTGFQQFFQSIQYTLSFLSNLVTYSKNLTHTYFPLIFQFFNNFLDFIPPFLITLPIVFVGFKIYRFVVSFGLSGSSRDD